ncbi:MAG: formylglycine-generating enzyme family protein [Lewinella sp.]|uniref:formylglycine-generating enzyme family protein n=1 Tax=Lewinella sp. TaxID=2004506 RepID=UPI003D6AAD4C
MMKIRLIILSILFIQAALGAQDNSSMKKITGGDFVPLYGSDAASVSVADFMLDVYPVTNEQYLSFVEKFSKWQRSKVIRLFADGNYLIKWQNDLAFNPESLPDAPITNVSWYAAKAYCECQGKRLPTMDEWEYAAMASATEPNAQGDSLFNQLIIEGYETPRTYKNKVGSTFKNYWGIYDLHGLVWEWTSDFNSVLISGESRKDVDTDNNLFCAGGSVNASDLMDYAAFMRYALRGSIKANYCIQTLGFRCAKNLKE